MQLFSLEAAKRRRRLMALEGLHHITAITGDAPGNVDFYASRLGLRLVKKTVNFDAPDVYHLYFGDEQGTPGSILTFFEFPGARRGLAGAGTVHHIAWSAADDAELTAVREQAVAAGAHATPIIDRQYFHSVYFREPSGVLFELATRDIGFTLDEPLETLGEALKLPPQHEQLRPQLERTLTPLVNPRAASRA